MKKINHGLNENQLKIICRILIPFIDYIDRISLFGSRATGLYKPNSDIDMVIYGSVDERMTNRISTMFNDSYLPLKVDVHSYNLISYQPLKEHIDNNELPLFTSEQIRNLCSS
jgi:predicted nucleotidyltransferase